MRAWDSLDCDDKAEWVPASPLDVLAADPVFCPLVPKFPVKETAEVPQIIEKISDTPRVTTVGTEVRISDIFLAATDRCLQQPNPACVSMSHPQRQPACNMSNARPTPSDQPPMPSGGGALRSLSVLPGLGHREEPAGSRGGLAEPREGHCGEPRGAARRSSSAEIASFNTGAERRAWRATARLDASLRASGGADLANHA